MGPRFAFERRLEISPAVIHQLRGLAAAEGAGLDVALLAALLALVARYAGQEQVVVAAEVGERTVAVELGGEPDARGLIRRVKGALDAPVPPADVPAVHLPPSLAADEHGVSGGGGDRIRFVLDETPRVSAGVTSADLELFVTDVPSAPLEACLVFRAERFDDATASRIVGHLVAIIEGLATGRAPSTISIVGDDERREILACSKVGDVRLDENHDSVIRLFEACVERTPDAVAIVDGERTLTYRQLDHAARALATRLNVLGVAANPIVAVYLERGADAVIAFVGILKARGAYVPIDTSYPEGRVAAILASAAPLAIVTRDALVSRLPGSADQPVLCIDGAEDEAGLGDAPRPDDAAYVIFTSGSTGQPKGVVVDHRTLSNYARAAVDAYGVRPEDHVLQGASLGFDLSLEEIVVTLTAGATLVVRSAPAVESIQSFLEECVARGVTILSITSALWHELTARLADGTVALPPLLRLVILGADVARPDVLAVWQRATAGRVRLVNSYGLTETTIVATVWEATSEPLGAAWRAVPIGRPLRNVSAYVLDAQNQLLPIGVPGEICIGGLAVASRYLGDDALTSARFVPDPFLPGQRMYRSGDRGRLRACGGLEFLGRVDYQLKVGGVRVELGEIEARLREVAGVVEAVVVARKTSAGDTELAAHIMTSANDVTAETLRAHLARVLPAATVPARLHVVDRFPLTPAGKIDRRALAQTACASDRAPFVAPWSRLEVLVARTLADVLGVPRVGMRDSFVSLGGTSLGAVRAASVLSKQLGQRVRAQLFFESPTVGEACVHLGSVATTESHVAGSSLERDAMLDPAIVVGTAAQGPAPLARVLLTGATGFYGTFVLADLLRETTAHVVCLVRGSSPEAARARVVASLEQRSCPVDASVLAARVTVLVGDLALPNLGVDEATFLLLSETVDAIFHVGALVNMLLPYEALRSMNVLAVEALLRLATTGRPKTVHHVSTVDVLNDTDPADELALCERPAASSPALLHEGYGQSKWVAERLVDAARARGVRTYVHRPGRLMGHSETGAFNVDDFLVRMLDACGQVGAAPLLDVELDITPVDYASQALVQLAKLEPAAAATFHLVNPVTVSWSALVAHIVALGYSLRVVPHDEWCALLERHAPSSDRAGFLLYLAGMSATESATAIHGGVSCEITSALLGKDLVCPAVDARLVATYVARLAAEGRFPVLALAA